MSMFMRIVFILCNYLRATPLPHTFAALCLLLATLCAMIGHDYAGAGKLVGMLGFCLVGFWLTAIACFALADGFSRFREFRRLVSLLCRYGYQQRIFKPAASSRCQRDAALAAAAVAGCRREALGYYRSLGYRWYHILPDEVMRNPFLFLSPTFIFQATFSKRLRPAVRET